MLKIAVEKVCDLIINSLALNASQDNEEDADGARFTELPEIDDDLEFRETEDRYKDLKRIISKLNEEEQINLVALAWVGRGTFSADEWDDAIEEARDLNPDHIADYLVNMSQLGDYLEEGLAELGYDSEEFETGIR
ncbi:DUF3775 domain-containing protein [Sneathiella chinensis]|uniref:DUF3775 domain-containing protein n=1 Tax=Sneathiella chinensis TaxID=349750 RepID=A0ABQ5U2B3_9PROT|nr:DUF3775 domain-containing protein [Sneathiella chinensis]GLQ05821.1 hypothetical protein GCM10007924_10420 [Sneathiella chinensis]